MKLNLPLYYVSLDGDPLMEKAGNVRYISLFTTAECAERFIRGRALGRFWEVVPLETADAAKHIFDWCFIEKVALDPTWGMPVRLISVDSE
ncbi:MAG: hypothetical protein U0836_16175 [Pirellulales bacterium]